MKTYRQNLNIWLEEKKNSSDNNEVKNILEEVQKHIKNIEKEEENMVNNAYENGYYDKELNRVKKSNYYQLNFKLHDKLKKMINLN
jgi:predicted transcriptional regulator